MNPTASTRVLTAAFVAAVLLALPSSAQRKQKGKRNTFTDTTSVVVVEIPVTVTSGGDPVDNLTEANFEVIDDRKKQAITGFEVIDLKKIDSLETVDRPVPMAARRHFLMLFDLAWSQPESIVGARNAARDLIDNLHPMDLAGVATYTSTQGANLLLNFTSDRRQLELAIQTLGAPKLVERSRDPLGLVFGSALDFAQENVVGDADLTAAGGGQAGDAIEEAAQEQILDMASRIAAAERANQVNKISSFTGNFEALADMLAQIDGRKHLVYFSEGIPSDILVGEENTVEQQQTRATTSLWEMSGDESFGHTQSQNQLEDMIERFRRAGCAIQSVDIGGLRALNEIGGRKSGEESLVSMSRDTGGDFYRNFNDLGEAMEEMLDRTSVTYVLAFQPQKLQLDGDYHRLKVKLVNGPRGARLSHRSGYYAPLPYDQADQGRRRLETAGIIMSDDEEGGPLEMDVLAAAFPVKGQKAYVPLLFEITGASLLAGASDRLGLEVYAYATSTETGGVYDFFVHPLGLDLSQPQVKAGMEQSGLKYWGHFDLPPGRYTARVMVRDINDGRYTLKRQGVVVPEFDNSEALLLPPMFPEAQNKWLLARETQDRQREVDYPFMVAGQPYIPAVKPVVPAKGSTPFYLQGLNLSGDVSFDGEVMAADGTPVSGATLKMAPPQAAAGMHVVTAELQTKGLKPGEYTLVATATDASGVPHESSIRFVVK